MLPSNLKSISHELRYFQWDAYPLPCLPSGFCAEKIVELRMPDSHAKKLWDGVQVNRSIYICFGYSFNRN